MAKKEVIEVEGLVTEALPNGMFRVELPNKHMVLAHVSGKIRLNFIRVLMGDRVLVEATNVSLERRQIDFRLLERLGEPKRAGRRRRGAAV